MQPKAVRAGCGKPCVEDSRGIATDLADSVKWQSLQRIATHVVGAKQCKASAARERKGRWQEGANAVGLGKVLQRRAAKGAFSRTKVVRFCIDRLTLLLAECGNGEGTPSASPTRLCDAPQATDFTLSGTCIGSAILEANPHAFLCMRLLHILLWRHVLQGSGGCCSPLNVKRRRSEAERHHELRCCSTLTSKPNRNLRSWPPHGQTESVLVLAYNTEFSPEVVRPFRATTR